MPTNNSWNSQDPAQVIRGGTGLNSCAQGDLLYGSAANTLLQLNKDATATRYLSNTGAGNNPAWAQVNLTNGVTGALPEGNGGTGQTYVPSFNAHKSASALNVTGNGAAYDYVCDSEEFDVGNNYNTATGVFTAPFAGKYFFTTRVLLQGCTVATVLQIKLITSTMVYRSQLTRAASAADFNFTISSVASMAAGATCYPQVTVAGEAGNTDDVYGGAESWTIFGGFYIGA